MPFAGCAQTVPGIGLLIWSAGELHVRPDPGWLLLLILNLLASATVSLAFSWVWGSLAFWAPRAAEEVSSSANRTMDHLKAFPPGCRAHWLAGWLRPCRLGSSPGTLRGRCSASTRRRAQCSSRRSRRSPRHPWPGGRSAVDSRNTPELDRPAISPSDSAGDTVVELRGVRKSYRQRQLSPRLRDALRDLLRPRWRDVEALRGVDLTVARGEVVAYAGPNGAAKSTTVKLLAGLLAPDAGTVRVLGLDPSRDRVGYVGRIGVVFGQRTELWWDHPVETSFEWKRVVWDVPRDRYEGVLGF